VCVSRFGDLGQSCASNAACQQNLCLPLGNGSNACTRTCNGAVDCLGGWTCGPLSGVTGNVCQCVVAQESCNGEDDDCNGIPDDQDAEQSCTLSGTECRGGSCVCETTLRDCSGTCADLARSNEHCGMCNRPCTATGEDQAECVDAQCKTARHLWGSYAHVESMLAVGNELVFAQEAVNGSPPPATVQGFNFSTGAATFTVSTTNPRRLATNGTDVFFTNNDGILRLNRANNTAQLVWAEPSGRAVSLAASATHLYWSINAVDRAQSRLRRCSLPACSDAVDVAQGEYVSDLLLDGDNLYWFAEFQNDAGWETRLRRCAATGCLGGATTLLTGPTLRSLRAHGGRFYWAQGGSDGIRSCAAPDCTAPLTVVESAYVYGLAVDNTGVFWTSGSIGSGVSTCPLSGCTTPRLLFGGGTEEPQALVLGTTHLAFSSTYDLFMLPR
jgi:hypothetical protein